MMRGRCARRWCGLHGDRELRLEYAHRAYERAVRHYMAGRMVDEYVEAYASLLGQRARAA